MASDLSIQNRAGRLFSWCSGRVCAIFAGAARQCSRSRSSRLPACRDQKCSGPIIAHPRFISRWLLRLHSGIINHGANQVARTALYYKDLKYLVALCIVKVVDNTTLFNQMSYTAASRLSGASDCRLQDYQCAGLLFCFMQLVCQITFTMLQGIDVMSRGTISLCKPFVRS